MKIRITLPWGGELYYERQPMDKDRFEAVCFLVGLIVLCGFAFKLLMAACR